MLLHGLLLLPVQLQQQQQMHTYHDASDRLRIFGQNCLVAQRALPSWLQSRGCDAYVEKDSVCYCEIWGGRL